MKKEFDDFLNATFPILFRGRRGMGVGFECNDGWFDIIYSLAHDLELEIKKLPLEDQEHITAVQVKEKYGTLRFYMSSETDRMSELIAIAEDMSSKTCEVCGSKGELREGGWYTTLCETHFKEREKRNNG